MNEWTWKQAVADCVLQLANSTLELAFTIEDIYSQQDHFEKLFPKNRHVREKIRQTLQRLRDDGLLRFHGGGRYSVNLEYEDLTGDPDPLVDKGFEVPETKQVVRSLRLRCTVLATEVKRRYGNLCQLCRKPVILRRNSLYSEAHHLRPLGKPHLGPDVLGNIIVVCPNHHVMFDRGAATVTPETLEVRHVVTSAIKPKTFLHLADWHKLNIGFLRYHHERIFTLKNS